MAVPKKEFVLTENKVTSPDELDHDRWISLVHDLVAIASFSGNEAVAVRFLVDQMGGLGYSSHIDAAGNAVGIRGEKNAEGKFTTTIILLGHIDTVSGDIPVRIESGILHGRGSVDAKGPLATLVAAGSLAELPPGIRLIAVGAVEEETATSRGARQIAADYIADYCVIGEPSGTTAITLGYKGRVLVEYQVEVDEGHTAGPQQNGAEIAAAFWQSILSQADLFNEDKKALFDQILPSLRSINSSSDGMTSRASAKIGVRLPPNFNFEAYRKKIAEWAGTGKVEIYGHEPAWQSDRTNLLVRCIARTIAAKGERASYKLKTGTADLNVVGPVWKCPIIAYGPGDSSLDHTPREHLVLSEYLQAIAILRDSLTSLAHSTVQG